MDKNDVWNLFKITGKVEYYLKYTQMIKKESGTHGDKRS